MLESSWVAAQLAASREGLSSMSEWVYSMLKLGTEERHGTVVKQIVILSTSPHLALYVVSASFVLALFFGGGERIPPPPAFELPDCGLVHHDVTQTRDYHNKWQWEANPSRLFFIIYCDPFLTSRKPFTNSFNLFPGLPFISVFICYSPFYSGSVYFISLCF
jgi:hypothetical protein